MSRRHESGAALFTAVFLLVVIAVVGTAVALVSTTQQVASGRALDATRAYYAARARLDREIAALVATTGAGNPCPATGGGSATTIQGFTTRVETCNAVAIDEGGGAGADYDVFTLTVSGFRGDRGSGTLVRREIEAVITNRD